ncbi:DEAD/DEAH box helicase [Kosakonia sp. WA-90]|uniref:DEAD/DEAH box helicase n=1 Tax=Kosakonia sp. WA-90 TaxID=3153576 RepID=UPI00325E1CC8
MRDITIRRLLNTPFKDLYSAFLLGNKLSQKEYTKLLAVAVVLMNQQSLHLRRLGYRIILLYTIQTKNYNALFDVSINNGLLPISASISKDISEQQNQKTSFFREFIDSYIDNFRDEDIVMTEQQFLMREYVREQYSGSVVIVAPTSYGKSELIISAIKDHPFSRICIIVPSKALLAQTKKRIINADINDLGKVITHPESYNDKNNPRIFVLTQERLNRLLSQNDSVYFDMVFVDEAHNLLSGDSRNELLATVLCILWARNNQTSFKFLTPFICDELNLKIRYLNSPIGSFRINEYVKTERFYLCDFRTDRGDNILKQYDHYLDVWVDSLTKYNNPYDLIKGEGLAKNIIYANRPKNIERLAQELSLRLPIVDCPLIKKACDELSSSFDKQYLIIECLRHGIAYHHGSISDNVRLYIEDLFSKSTQLKYLICSATLLEGVNLPIDRLFLIDNRKGPTNLTPSQFKNLVGRVNRFSEVFSAHGFNTIERLESCVYLVGIDSFTTKRADLDGFYRRVVKVDKIEKDTVTNVLLEATQIKNGINHDLYINAVERLENLHPGLVQDVECQQVVTVVGRLIISNSINEIDVFTSELSIQEKIDSFYSKFGLVKTTSTLMEIIKLAFIDFIDVRFGYKEVSRLKEEAARNFYAMLLDWRMNKITIKQVIYNYIQYWDDRVANGLNNFVYVGKWGDVKYENSHQEHWVNMAKKSRKDKINLAIVRHKEEDDFIDHKIIRFVEVLNSLDVLDASFYKLIKYGTTDASKIKLIQDGFSRGLSDIIVDRYANHISFLNNEDIFVSRSLISEMVKANENELMVFEAKMNVKL